eukprot:COSAG01_NODE_2733_length_7167_cov_48.846067_9_plen_57_part_00
MERGGVCVLLTQLVCVRQEAFKGREAHREAKKLDQRRAETGNITFSAGEERGIVGR